MAEVVKAYVVATVKRGTEHKVAKKIACMHKATLQSCIIEHFQENDRNTSESTRKVAE